MTVNKILVGNVYSDEDQVDKLADIIEALDIEPIDSLLDPLLGDVDYYSIIDILHDIIDKLP